MAIRILIADDNDLVRRALRLALENRGHWEVVEAKDGEEAVRKAKEVRPSLVILDLAMPVMDGMRAARAIGLQVPAIPIIMHTLHWSPRVAAEALKAGVRRVVAKSDSATILGAVEELLSPELMGYVATIAEPEALPANITIVRPPSESEIKGAVEAGDPGDLIAHDANNPADR
jgi:DNA-binding NarL/FixJ family response regulator